MIIFVVLGGIVRASPVVTDWGFEVVLLEAVLTCIVKCGKCMRPCVVSRTTLSFLIKGSPKIGCVRFISTTKFSANILSQIQIQSWLLLTVSLTCQLLLVLENRGGSPILRRLLGGFLFCCVKINKGKCTDVGSLVYQGNYC